MNKDGAPDAGEGETVLVLGNWQYIDRGHSPGEAIYARTIANDLAENRRIWQRIRTTVNAEGDWT